MNLFLILIPQSLNSQFLNLAPYSHYDDDGVQKSDIVFRSNNEICINVFMFKTCRKIIAIFGKPLPKRVCGVFKNVQLFENCLVLARSPELGIQGSGWGVFFHILNSSIRNSSIPQFRFIRVRGL